MSREDHQASWKTAIDRFAGMDLPVAKFNVGLLQSLRPAWDGHVSVTTSMFALRFHGLAATFPFEEEVSVQFERADKVSIQLARNVPRKTLDKPGGHAVVAGDFTSPANALPVVESFLMQLSRPDGVDQQLAACPPGPCLF